MEIGKLATVEVDPVQIRQLFQNLISTAIKFCRQDEKPIVNISGHIKGEVYQVFVKDNGIGFEEQYSDRIFRPFQKLHGRDEYGGTGMGLAICRKIAEHHGGSITAKSTPGKGATFIVSLFLWKGNQSSL